MEIELNEHFNWKEEPIEIWVTLEDIEWQGAEPDVGIMSAYIDGWTEAFYIGEEELERSQFCEKIAPMLMDMTKEELDKQIDGIIDGYIEEIQE